MKQSRLHTNPTIPSAVVKISKIIFGYFIKNPDVIYVRIPTVYCDKNTVAEFELNYDKVIESLKAGTFRDYFKTIEFDNPIDSQDETVNSLIEEIGKLEPDITSSDLIQSQHEILNSVVEESFPDNTPCNSDDFIKFYKTTKNLREEINHK